MTFAVYSLRIATDLPLQSEYLPKISWYFITSITFNLISMLWFVYQERCRSKSEIPTWLGYFGEKLKLLFCLCFPPEKEKNKKVAPLGSKNVQEDEKKCKFCDRCNDCEKIFKKDDDKKKLKKDVDAKLDAVNHFIFLSILFSIFITQMAIWVSIN